MVEQVRRIDPQIEVVSVLQSEGPRQRRIEGERIGAGDRISPRVSPLARERRCIRGSIQMKTRGRIINRCTRNLRSDTARYTSAGHRRKIDGRLRQTTPRGELAKPCPSLQQLSPP